MKTDVAPVEDRRWWMHLPLGLVLLAYATGQIVVILLGPGLFTSHDEANFLVEGMRLPVQGKMGGYAHGPFMYGLMAGMEGGWYVISRAFGAVGNPVEHLANVLANPSPHIKAARLLIALVGLLCLIQVYRMTRLLSSRWAAVMATLLCACSLTFGLWTGMAKEDAIYWLLVLTAGDLMWRASPTSKLRPILAGVAVGAGFSAKYLAFFGMVLALLPLIRAGKDRATAFRQGLLMAVAALVSVLIFFPFLIIDTAGVLKGIKGMSEGLAGMTSRSTFSLYILDYLPTLAGPFVAGAAIAELAIRIRKEPRGPILVFTPTLLLLVMLVSRQGYVAAHYIFPVVIVGFVLAGAFAGRVADQLRGPLRALPFVALAVVALFDPAFLPSRVKFALVASGPDTRALAAEQIAKLVPPNECVVVSGGVQGWNHYGAALAPTEISSGVNPTGPYAQAERLAIGKRPGPHYRLKILEGFEMARALPADCNWAVGLVTAERSTMELAGANDAPQGIVPEGFVQVAEVRGLPPVHSIFYPFLNLLDYQELRSTPISRLWRERAMGSNQIIYRRATPTF